MLVNKTAVTKLNEYPELEKAASERSQKSNKLRALGQCDTGCIIRQPLPCLIIRSGEDEVLTSFCCLSLEAENSLDLCV